MPPTSKRSISAVLPPISVGTGLRGAASVVVLGELTPQGPKELGRLSGEGHGPCGLLFSPDGKTLYVGNGNATISIYRASQ